MNDFVPNAYPPLKKQKQKKSENKQTKTVTKETQPAQLSR